MMIDQTEPTEKKGKPTREQAREVWDSTPDASARTVAAKMQGLGYDVSFRTIARWRSAEWRIPPSRCSITGSVAGHVRDEMHKAGVLEKAKVQPETKAISGLEAAVASSPRMDELVMIEMRRQELMAMSEAQLDQIAAKARIVNNILLMEQAARRSHIMVLIPKETAALVDSLTEASKRGLTGADGQPPRGDDARVIDGHAIPAAPAPPPNEVADAIDKFLASQAA